MKYFELTKQLVLREIKARYKQSFLGIFWVVLNPFFQMLVMSFVFSKVVRFQNLGVPYPVYLYAGLLPWTFFDLSLRSSMGILVDNASLLKKVYFPRQILILSALVAKAVDFCLASLIFILLLLYYQIPFNWLMLLFFPLFLLQFLFTFGLAMLLSSLNLFYRDVQYLFNLCLTLWFYLTPIIYATEFFPQPYRWIFKINPMSVFINAYRQIIFNGKLPNFGSLTIGFLIALLIYLIGHRIFKKLEGTFADIV
jgi:ABC-type polysaccharide/polyol phosphate export permease